MGKALDRIVTEYTSGKMAPGSSEDDRVALANSIKATIIEEISSEEAHRSDKRAQELAISRRAKQFNGEATKLILEAVALAVVVGLLVNDSFQWFVIKTQLADGTINLAALEHAWWVLLTICVLIVGAIVFKGIAEIVQTYFALKNDEPQ